MDITLGEKRKSLYFFLTYWIIIRDLNSYSLRLNILNTVVFPVLSHSLVSKSPYPRKSSVASLAILHVVKYGRYTARMHACIGRAGAARCIVDDAFMSGPLRMQAVSRKAK